MAAIPMALSEASLSSSSSSGESELSTRDDINTLTNHVKAFREALAKLKRIFHPERDKSETQRVSAHERLGEVLRAMREILEKYPKIQSTELLMAAGGLIQQVKGYNYEETNNDPTHFIESVDALALAFSTRVSEYLMGDLDLPSIPSTFKSIEHLSPDCVPPSPAESLSPNDIDDRFLALPEGIDLALHRAKVWSKYAKDVINYIEKRAQIEAEHARTLIKHAQTMKTILKEETFLPFQSIYCTAIDQDIENGNSCLATCALLLGHKFVEPLSARRSEHEKARKSIKDMWTRELKRMHEAVNNIRKSRALYVTRQHELEKARSGLKTSESGVDSVEKIEKKRRAEDDAIIRAQEAESNYKTCVHEANDRAANLHKVKRELLVQIRELLCACEVTMKAVTCSYFQLCHVISAPLPVQFQTLSESARIYEPGTSYMEFVKRLPTPVLNKTQFTFQPHVPSSGEREHESSESDSNLSSPAASPQSRVPPMNSSGEEIEIDNDFNANNYIPSGNTSHGAILTNISKAAESHTFRKLKTPSRCRECDSYVYFQGVECSECGLASHKKCLETLPIQCGHVKLPRKMTTFGVLLVNHGDDDVPPIVTKCVKEIDARGSNIKGIYRVSGVKSRVEKLCQNFESGHDHVDLSSIPANVIANVLKLYLRQLPEPLMTFRLYSEFIHIAKAYPSSIHSLTPEEEIEMVSQLKPIVERMPKVHYKTLAYLMHHLRRISESSHDNNMPPSNLGIVFGPTLLRTSKGGASLSSLVDTVHQTRIIELLITYSRDIFGPDPDDENDEIRNNDDDDDDNEEPIIENPPIQAKVFKSATCVTISGQKVITGSKVTSSGSTSGKQSIVEARRQFFNTPSSPPQFRSTISGTNFATLVPLNQSIQSSASSTIVHPKLRRTSSSQQSQSGQLTNELSRSATHTLNFSSRRKYV